MKGDFNLIECFTGLPGEGKSYALAYRTAKGILKGRNVFTNFPVGGAYKLEMDMLKNAKFPSNSLIVIDEAGFFFNSREWKSMPKETYQLFSQHRKFKMDMVLAVQSVSRLDVSIRELINVVWWSKAYPPVIRPVFIKYEKYFDPEDMGNEDMQGKSSFLPFRKKYADLFNTYEIIADYERENLKLQKWSRQVELLTMKQKIIKMFKIIKQRQKQNYRRRKNIKSMKKTGKPAF